jgi:chromosome segregation ATPase
MWFKDSGNLVTRMRKVIVESADMGGDVKKAYSWLFQLRKEYDELCNETVTKGRTYQKLKREYESMQNTFAAMKQQQKINNKMQETLQMKLNTVTIKILETEENKKNYKMNITHLKEEELIRHYQLDDLRKASGANDVWMKKMNDLKLQSLEEKDKAEAELIAFGEEIEKFEIFVKEQKHEFQMIANEAIRKRNQRERENAERQKKAQEKFLIQIDKLETQMEEKYKEAASMSQKLASVNERLRYFKKRFQQIVSATGLEHPEAIINKFQLKEAIRRELDAEIKAKEKQTIDLNNEREHLMRELERAKNMFEESRWKDVDQKMERLREQEAQEKKFHPPLRTEMWLYRFINI